MADERIESLARPRIARTRGLGRKPGSNPEHTGRGPVVIRPCSSAPPPIELHHAPVAQLDRAMVFETIGCRFKSCRARSLRRPLPPPIVSDMSEILGKSGPSFSRSFPMLHAWRLRKCPDFRSHFFASPGTAGTSRSAGSSTTRAEAPIECGLGALHDRGGQYAARCRAVHGCPLRFPGSTVIK